MSAPTRRCRSAGRSFDRCNAVKGGVHMTQSPDSTTPNATRGDSWCRRYTVGPRLIPVPADAPLPVAEPLPEWLKRSKRLTHALPLPAGYDSSAASAARKSCHPPPDGLRTRAEAARKLRCSIKTLNGHVASGALRYVVIGHGTKRPRRMFTDADLDDFIANQTRKDSPCPSARTRVHRFGDTTSRSEVIAFTARRSARPSAKRKR